MFGLEEKDKKKKERFAFDLERQVKEDHTFRKELSEKTETRIHELKKLLKEGAHEKDFDRLGVLLDGYTSLQKVLKKITK
ncbi:MAG: hypothetical protein A3F67_01565 [Verrucomicrobia bacterium RIFCSPHIGHO2_12_FULL_41_10]|nr:MAG: hypothetical protein A3F67_01565 [Verrucomicrobia bacterium RIFCSPHIGHO2_12_FULL_41_10]